MNRISPARLCILVLSMFGLSAPSTAQIATIDAGKVKQYIDGFGASSAWHGR